MSLIGDYQMIFEHPITEYKTILGNYPEDFDSKINQAIKDGFQPYGNAFFDTDYLIQPMVRRGNKESVIE